jgi:colanic acid biosynthesis glycosyl transferase WcaI
MAAEVGRNQRCTLGADGNPANFEYLTFYASAGRRLWCLVCRGDVVVAKTDPPLISLLATPIAALKGARVVNWLQDVFLELASASGVKALPRPFANMLRRLRNGSLQRAHANVALGKRMTAHLRREGIARNTIEIISNWSDG